MANQTVIKLQDGNVMPQLGLGVWKAGNDEVVSAIHKALEVGYRSIDTAAAYKNEDGSVAGESGETPARFRRSLSHALAGTGYRPLR